ncbi:MAG: efflux RND transporter periplasmic adaptor subunit, partial [Holosporales bacterium]|nr:efflux RND transporter periplasmic adaptor subunit [Holosporales bacterium]
SAAEVLAVEQEPIADRAEKSFSKDIWKRAKQFIAELFQRKPVAETAVKEQEFVVDSIEDKQFEVSPDEFDTSKSFKARLKRFLSRLFRKKHATESNAVEDDLIVNGKDEIIEASTPEADTGKSAWSKVKQFFARVFRKGSTEEMPIAAQKPIIDKIGNILGRDIWKRAKQFLVELSQRKPVAKAAAKNQKPIADSLENKPMEAGIISAESSKIAGFFDKIFSKKKTDKDVLDTLNLQHSVPIVNVASARLGQVQHVTNLIGSLRASNDVTIRSEVDGKITRILFEEGRKVNEGDLLIEVDDAGLRIHVREIQAQLMLAKAEYKRAKELARQEFLSKSELEKKRAEVLIMESKLGVSKEELSKFKIKAPFAGIVGLRELSVGEYVTKNKELLRIVSDQDVRVDFKVPEMLVAGMQIGQIIYIRIDGIHGEFPAEVLAINPEADQMSHSFTVRAVLQYQNEDMRPGLFVRVSVPSTSSSEAILVPESAVSHIGDNDIVFRVVDGMAMKTPVTIGVRQNGEVEILTGINADDIVITAGQLRVRDGSMVQISTDIDSLGHQ